MTQRNLVGALRPQSVAVVGASIRPGSVGRVVIENILAGGYGGAVHAVNPKYGDVLGVRCVARLADLPAAPDLAVIVTPPTTVPGIIAELGAAGGRAAVVITAGLTAENGLRQKMLDAARPHLLRVIGPNTIGLLVPGLSLNASFARALPRPGRLALVSQSGAMVSALADWAAAEGVGFGHMISLGDASDVDAADCLDFLGSDGGTSAVLMYLESIPAARKFMSAARTTARIKPVIALKPGRTDAAQQAARTHTGALAGTDRVVEAALARAGVIRVDDLEDLFTAAEVTGRYRPLRNARVAVVTNGGGAGVLAVDHLTRGGDRLAALGAATMAALDAALPATWSRANPVDIIGDAPPERYAAAVTAAAADPGVDALLVMNCPTALASPVDAARAVAETTSKGTIDGKPVIACWLGKRDAEPARALLEAAGIANLDTPVQAARAVTLLTRWSRVRDRLQRMPSAIASAGCDRDGAASIIAAVLAEGRTLLTEPEAKDLLAAYRIAVPETLVAADEEEAARLAAGLLERSPAVVVKLLSRTLTHKSDVGGVALDLRSPEEARAAAAAIRARVAAVGGTIDGFSVQTMVRRRHAEELLVGLSTDPVFGPTIVFGAGGTGVEVIDDTASGLVPLDSVLAGDLIDGTRIARLLAGYRDRPAADREAIVATLIALSQIAIDHPAVVGLDINPLLANHEGAIALDARVELDPVRARLPSPNPALAIRPYPAEAERTAELGGETLTVRPIRPEDAALYPEFLAQVSAEDMRLRFLAPVATLSAEMMVRLTQLDYDREMAFVALDPGGALLGVARYAADPDRARAEFAVLVRSDLKGKGLGSLLMRTLIDHARSEGIGRLEGNVLGENTSMLELGRSLGFETDAGASLRRIVLPVTGRD